jgi:hypothetical protein
MIDPKRLMNKSVWGDCANGGMAELIVRQVKAATWYGQTTLGCRYRFAAPVNSEELRCPDCSRIRRTLVL